MKTNLFKRVISVFLSVALIVTCLPISTMAATSKVAISDPGTSDAWEKIMGSKADGNRYAGRVWVDKSVYTDGDTVNLGSTTDTDLKFDVELDEANGEYFQVVFSALGSSMSTNTQKYVTRPLDVVIVLDTSTSMDDTVSGRTTRFEYMINAANKLLEQLSEVDGVRISIVSFNADSETILDLKEYKNGIVLSVNSYTNKNGGGVITAKDKNGNELGKDSGYTYGTNLQDGIDRGMDILANATGTAGRAPVAIVLADGAANRAVSKNWYSPSGSSNLKTSGDSGIILSTLLNAAYGKTRVEKKYNTDMTVYGVGVDLSSSDTVFLNPGDEGNYGFNSTNTNNDVKSALSAFNTWKTGTTATIQTSSWMGSGSTWTFDHNWPDETITTAEITENINYVDDYQDVDGVNIDSAFDTIFDNLSAPAFNPITSSSQGATGVEETPLIYVDNIGKYMEVKEIQALRVFGQTFPITKNADGTYSITHGSGVNPTTNENWSTAGSVDINLLTNADGTQQLRIYIYQEILPILLDKINETEQNGNKTVTLEEVGQVPLRIFYTVGIEESVLLPNGEINPAKIDSDYEFLNTAEGTASFYSNAFGVLNTTDADGNGKFDEGDAHVGFIPSHDNRYYYHQDHQDIYISATKANGSAIDWNDGYAVEFDESFNLTNMTYANLGSMTDSTEVYTKIKFIRPTGSGNKAEEVTYLIKSTWDTLVGSATYFDTVNGAYLNGGAAIEMGEVDTVVQAYKNGKTLQNNQLNAVLGIDSRRVSRLNNMFETKTDNATDSAETSYAPKYSDEAENEDDMHEHSEVIVWLGNNGKLTLPVASGIKVTKLLTEVALGEDANEAFEIRLLLDMDYTAENVAELFVADVNGDALADAKFDIENSGGNILVKVYLANNESAIIMGVPNGTNFGVTEAEHNSYTATYSGATEAVAGKIVEGVVTNSPVSLGSLYITKEVVHAYSGDAFPKNYDFKFKVTFKYKNGTPIANYNFELENNYDVNLTERATDANGIMVGWLRHGETVHIKNIPTGAEITVEEVEIPANYTGTEYRSRDYSGAEADNDGKVTIHSGQNATVVVTNTYTPSKVGVDISFSGTKNFDATNMTEDSEFTFKLQEYVDGEWSDVEDKIVTVTAGTNEEAPFSFTDLNLEFSQPGVHSYQIAEVKGEDPLVTYDRSVYTFTVNVTLDNNGDLKAELVGHNEEPGEFEVSGDSENRYVINTIFTNYYHRTATSIEIKKEIEDKANSGKTSAGFVFETYEATVDANGNWIIGNYIRSTVTDAQGEARLVRYYDNDDFPNESVNEVTKYFILKEVDDGRQGWTYDETERHLIVKLTRDPATQNITATIKEENKTANGDTVTVGFKNVYNPADATLNLNTLVKKELTGRNMVAGEFNFAIRENGKTVNLATGTNDANGNVTFEPNVLTFDKVGKYEFDVVEIAGNKGGVTYDPITYDLVVEVTDNNGELKINYYYEDAVETFVTFKNTYTVDPINVVINGAKTLKVLSGNKSLHAGDYTFVLYNEAGNELGRTTNLADGTFKFNAIYYGTSDIGKTYKYTVKELAPDGTTNGSYKSGGVTWSGQSFEVIVTITDNGDGTITANLQNNGKEKIVFENTYDSKLANVPITGKKVLQNRPLKDKEFSFTLYSSVDNTFSNPQIVKNDITHDANGDIKFTLENLSVGRYYYSIKENVSSAKGIYTSAAEFRIRVDVADHGTGQMTYTTVVLNTAVPNVYNANIEFINVYVPEADEVPVSGTKIFNGGKDLEDGEFEVSLYNAQGEVIQTVPIKADGTFTFDNLVFNKETISQTFHCTISENIPEGATNNGDGTHTYGQVIYDGSIYTLTVTVTDEGQDGQVDASYVWMKDGEEVTDISFTNTFVPNPIAYNIQAKKTYEKGLKGNDFDFSLVSADDKTNVNQTKQNDVNGDVYFDPISFSKAGVYTFTVKEINTVLGFIRYSTAEYKVTITVENENGVLRVSDVKTENVKNTGETNLEFVNLYVIDGEDEVTFRGNKVLTGDRTEVKAEEFEFGLYDSEGTLIESVKNDVSGNFAFSTLKFDENDTEVGGEKQFTYTVKEIAGNNARYTYDGTVYTIVVTVADNDAGGVTASYTVNGAANGEIKFTNVYTNPAPVTYTPLANKKYNKALAGGEFKFTLEGEINGVKVEQEKTNAEGGAITFDTLSFPEAGVYTFTVKEIDKLLGFIEYSTAEYELVVTVIDTNGVLSLGAVTVNGDEDGTIEFTNTYVIDGEDEVTLRGNKVLTGDRTEVKAEEFEFGLYDSEGTLIESVKNDVSGNFAFSTLKFDENDTVIDGEKQFAYTVKEITGSDIRVTYDTTVYTVVVTVKDNGEGGVTASYTVNGVANGEIKFTNVYTNPDPVYYTPTAKKNYNKELLGGEFKFTLEGEINGVKVKQEKTNAAGGAIKFDALAFTEGGVYTFTVKEINTLLGFIEYSTAEYELRIVVADFNGLILVGYVTVNGDEDGTIEFTNTYVMDGEGEVPLRGNKVLTGDRTEVKENEFEFGLFDAEGNLVEAVKNDANGNFVFTTLKFDENNTVVDGETQFTYTVKEIAGSNARYTYDNTVYTVVVTVKDNDQGGITVSHTVNGAENGEIKFTNAYTNPTPVTFAPTANKIYNKNLAGGEFKFTLEGEINGVKVEQEKTNTESGAIAFDTLRFPEAGTYTFTVKEIDKLLGFIEYSTAEYTLVVNVIDTNGVLSLGSVTVNGDENGTIEFTNTYVIDGEDEVALRGNKVLTGDRTEVKENEFEFGLFDAEGNLVEAVKNDANGNFVFATLKFDENNTVVDGEKQFTYTVKEIAGSNARYTYDNTVYTVVVTVKDNDQGGITVSHTVNGAENGEIKFTNVYTNPTPVTYTPSAKKNYNKALVGGEFKFTLEGEINGVKVEQEKTNTESGAIAFDTLRFPEAGTYTFTVKEIDKLLGFIEYSTAEYTLVVNVIDTNGVLSLGSVTVNGDENGTIEFTNTYVIDGEDEVTLRGNKVLTGGRTEVKENEFEFGLFDAEGNLVEAVKNDADGNFAFTTLKFDEKNTVVNGEKQFTYTVKEIAGFDVRVTYDETVYTVVVTVKDNGKGGVTASYTVNGVADGAITFTNVYTPKPEDITVDFEIIKTVVNKGSEKIGPEGFEFLLNAMEEGLADVTVKTDENGKAKFTLTFTEDNIGKTCTYTITEINGGKENVEYSEAEYTVTVAIALNENNELVATLTKNGENTDAVVAEFENAYDYTPEPPTNPETGENNNLYLLFALLFISGGTVFGAAICKGKKKERN